MARCCNPNHGDDRSWSEAQVKLKVFLSYARVDKAFALVALEYLRKQKILSRHESVIVEFPDQIEGSTGGRVFRKAIESADTFVLIWTKAAAQSNFVHYEVGMADALGKSMIIATKRGEALPFPINLKDTLLVEVSDA